MSGTVQPIFGHINGFVIYASIKLYGISPRIDSHLTSLVGVVAPVTWIFGCSRKRARLVRSAWGRWRRRTRRERTFSFRRWTRRSSCCPWCSSSRKDFASLKCPETFGSDKRLDRLYYRTLCIPIMNYNSILNWTVDIALSIANFNSHFDANRMCVSLPHWHLSCGPRRK